MGKESFTLIPFFRGFSEEDLDRLLRYADQVDYAQGEVVFHQGDHGRELYLVVAGSVGFERTGDTGELQNLGSSRFGELFGELAFLQPQPRTATARASEKTTILAFSKPDIQKLLDLYPTLAAAFYHAVALELAKRLRTGLVG